MTIKSSEGLCEMCGHYVSVRQKAHILAEGKKTVENLLMLCPSCHIMFDTHIKPKLFTALRKAGITLPNSWEKSIYHQAAEASRKAREKNKRNNS
jgi:predicted restriction endonuclease